MNFPLHLQSYLIGKEDILLFIPHAQAVKEAHEQKEIAFPYWSKVWPAAIALSKFIVQQPQLIQSKMVLELGAGLGLPSLIAARFANRVLCTDASAEAVQIAAQSAVHHRLQNFSSAVLNWNCLPDTIEADVLLLSDINYEPANFAILQSLLIAFLQKGKLILLATPQRLMAKEFIAPLLPYCTQQHEFTVKESEGVASLVTVMVLQSQHI